MDPDAVLSALATGDHAECIVHLERIPGREPATEPLDDLAPELTARLRRAGIAGLWSHQTAGLRAARAGRHVTISTGTASGKSLVYQLATFERFLQEPKATAIYLFPTKALAQDQLRQVRAFALPAARAAVYDGDTPATERTWVRRNANLVITNPDMLHLGILPGHDRWSIFLRNLAFVVVDEMHTLRGIFGSHVANVLRRLRRLAAHYGARPTFICASATIGNPADLAERLVGVPFEAVTEDGAPRGEKLFALWNPPFVDPANPIARYSATSQAAALLSGLVSNRVRTIAFTRSRKGAELVAQHARDLLGRTDGLADRVAAYRAGYLPEERRTLEQDLVSGELLGVASTSALELGIDIGGLDACVLAGYPGTIAATWQRAGRAGRARQRSLAVLIAQDDPLDQYLVTHPDEIFRRTHEAAVIDHANPSILDAHLACAAYERPLQAADAEIFGPEFGPAVARLEEGDVVRTRGERRLYAGRGSPAADIDIRAAGQQVRIVEAGTGGLLGTAECSQATHTVHPGAIYIHQGEQYEVKGLDLESSVALVVPTNASYYTQSRDITDLRIIEVEVAKAVGNTEMFFGTVEVTNEVVGYVRKRLYSNEVIGEVPLAMPPQTLVTKAVWHTVAEPLLGRARLAPAAVAGAAHAAEHAAIGLMPLFATCDRWDIGGVSYAENPQTGLCTIFIYDGYPGGAGFAARSYRAGGEHLEATLDLIRQCPCERGCPSCVQSPKCGNGNEPLDKDGAARLLAAVLGVGATDSR